MTITPEELKALVELEKKATQGEWRNETKGMLPKEGICILKSNAKEICVSELEIIGGLNSAQDHYNMRFIAAARNIFPRLLAEIARLQDIEKIAVDWIEDIECYTSCGACELNHKSRTEVLEKIKTIRNDAEKGE